jgi:SAM-dependent methyltransferase
MSIIRTRNHVEEFAARARYFPAWHMSGRGPEGLTSDVCRNVMSYLGELPEGPVLDVGCGDGSLLRLLRGEGVERIGVAPSGEEVARLRAMLPEVRFELGGAQALPFPDCSIAALISNSVFHTLPSHADAAKAVAEFSWVCRRGALVYLGEMPVEGVKSQYQHDSISAWLWSLLTRSGVRSFLAGLREVAQAAVTSRPLLFYPERWLYFPREPFLALCRDSGLRLVRDRVTPHAASRRDYLFTRE